MTLYFPFLTLGSDPDVIPRTHKGIKGTLRTGGGYIPDARARADAMREELQVRTQGRLKARAQASQPCPHTADDATIDQARLDTLIDSGDGPAQLSGDRVVFVKTRQQVPVQSKHQPTPSSRTTARTMQPANPGRRAFLHHLALGFAGAATLLTAMSAGSWVVAGLRNRVDAATQADGAVTDFLTLGAPFDHEDEPSEFVCYISASKILTVAFFYPARNENRQVVTANPTLLLGFNGTPGEQLITYSTTHNQTGYVDAIRFAVISPLSWQQTRQEAVMVLVRDAHGFAVAPVGEEVGR